MTAGALTRARVFATPVGPIRAILADDHTMLREALRRALESEGIRVLAEAADGEEAVRLAVGLAPDVALVDLTMPVIDGVEVIRRIHDLNPRVRVLVLTMHDDPAVVQAAMRAGAAAYLVKDCGTEELVDAVRRVAQGETVIASSVASAVNQHSNETSWSLTSPLPASVAADANTMTHREEEILVLVAGGRSTQEIADELGISHKTVKNHLASIYQKLEVRDRTQAVLRAMRLGVLQID